MSKRRELEDYAKNVLRPNLCKTRSHHINSLANALVYACMASCIAGFCLTLPSPGTSLSYLFVGVPVVFFVAMLSRVWYWRRAERVIRGQLDQLMAELRKPGEPEKGPMDFAMSTIELPFEREEYTDLLLYRFKREPELVFPSPPSSDLV